MSDDNQTCSIKNVVLLSVSFKKFQWQILTNSQHEWNMFSEDWQLVSLKTF